MKKTCRSPMLVHLEWVSVLADGAVRTPSGRWGWGRACGFLPSYPWEFFCFVFLFFKKTFFFLF